MRKINVLLAIATQKLLSFLQLKKNSKDAKQLLAEIRALPCVACGNYPSDPAHIRSVGAGGSNEPWNLMPLDRKCHSLQHQIGWKSFANKYPHVYDELKIKGWYFDSFNKLRRDIG